MNYLTDDNIIAVPLVKHVKMNNDIMADYGITQSDRNMRNRRLKKSKETGKRTVGSEAMVYKNNNLN